MLLKAAFREVAEKGFSHVTLEHIALRAGVSKGVTLYYFSSKDDLFKELFSWLIDSIQQRMREAGVTIEANPSPALVAALQSGAASAQQDWCARSGPACQQVLGVFKSGKP